MHDVDFRPVAGRAAAHQLAACVGADRNDDIGGGDLAVEAQARRLVDLVRTVHGEAEARSAHPADQHCDLGRIGTEMGVQTVDRIALEPVEDTAGMRQVDQVIGPGTQRAARHGQRGPGAAEHGARVPQRPPDRRQEKRRQSRPQRVAGAAALRLVRRVRKIRIPAPQRETRHPHTLPFERQDLAPDEGMADLGILVDEVGDGQPRRRRLLRTVRNLVAGNRRGMHRRRILLTPRDRRGTGDQHGTSHISQGFSCPISKDP